MRDYERSELPERDRDDALCCAPPTPDEIEVETFRAELMERRRAERVEADARLAASVDVLEWTDKGLWR